MTAAPKVSVIMANYNGARFLRAAIGSLLRQTLPSWELIFVDDGSTDASVAVAERAASADPRITVIRQPANRGPGAARNRALELARGEWIAVFDSDDLMMPQRLELLVRRADEDNAALVADDQLLFSDAGGKPRRFLKNGLGLAPRWIDLAALIKSTKLYSFNPDFGYLKPLVRASVIKRLHARYNERLRIGEDYNFLARILAEGHQLRLYPLLTYLYRKHESSVSYRMSDADIRALIEADDFLFRRPDLTHQERISLRQRRHSLESLLVYDTVITALKAGEPKIAASLALSHPFIWPLLTRPINARLKRLWATLKQSQALGAQWSIR